MELSSAVQRRHETLVVRPPSRWPSVGLRELWRYRELLLFFAWRDLKVRYKQTFLGVTWAVLQPIMYMVVFTLFFGRIAGLYSEGKPYALLALSGSVIWLYFANAVNFSSNSLVGNANLITKVYFPRLDAPLAPVLAGLVDLVLSTTVLVVVMAAYGVYPGFPRVLMAIPFVLLAMGTAAGVGAWLAAINVKYRDVRYIVPFLLQLWLFASPVVYSAEPRGRLAPHGLLPESHGGAVEGFRWAFLGGTSSGVLERGALRARRRVLPRGRRPLLPPRGAELRGHRLTPSIQVRELAKRYRLGESDVRTGACARRSRPPRIGPCTAHAAARGPQRERDLGARSRLLRRRARARCSASIGRNGAGKTHAAEAPLAHHRPDRGRGAHPRAASAPCSRSAPASTASSPAARTST